MSVIENDRMFLDWCPLPVRRIILDDLPRELNGVRIPVPMGERQTADALSSFDPNRRMVMVEIRPKRYRYPSTEGPWWVERWYGWDAESGIVIYTEADELSAHR